MSVLSGDSSRQTQSKVVLYIATSLDGKIARKDGSLDWLHSHPNPDQLDYGYYDFLKTIDVVIMGRKTYDEILGFDVDWPYREMDSYVVSRNSDLEIRTPKTQKLVGHIAESVLEIKKKSKKDIWLIGGGELISYFMNQQVIDRLHLSIIPTVIGEGISLFDSISDDSKWNLNTVDRYDNGVVSTVYDRE